MHDRFDHRQASVLDTDGLHGGDDRVPRLVRREDEQERVAGSEALRAVWKEDGRAETTTARVARGAARVNTYAR